MDYRELLKKWLRLVLSDKTQLMAPKQKIEFVGITLEEATELDRLESELRKEFPEE